MNRPFVTAAELIAYTSYASVQKRDTARLESDITRAELLVMKKCYTDFSELDEDNDNDSVAIQTLKTVVMMLAEMYAFNAEYKASAANSGGGGPTIKSETHPDYSYQLSDASADLITYESLGIDDLLESLCGQSTGDTFMRFTVL